MTIRDTSAGFKSREGEDITALRVPSSEACNAYRKSVTKPKAALSFMVVTLRLYYKVPEIRSLIELRSRDRQVDSNSDAAAETLELKLKCEATTY